MTKKEKRLVANALYRLADIFEINSIRLKTKAHILEMGKIRLEKNHESNPK